MKNFYELLKQLDPEQLIEKVRRLLLYTDKPWADQILTTVQNYMEVLDDTEPIDSPCILWGFSQYSEVEARIVCMKTYDDQAWCEPEETLTCESVNGYIHCSCFDSDMERWQWFLGMPLRVQRLNKFELTTFAASVILDIVMGTDTPDDGDLEISSANIGRLNRLRRAELKRLYSEFRDMLPHNALIVPWHTEKGWSRYGELKVVDYLPCAVCGSEADAGGIVHQVYGKRICSSCYAEIKAAAYKNSRGRSPWDTAPKARFMKRES